MNEGHSALLTLALLEEYSRRSGHTPPAAHDVESVRKHCVFTTHTPVPAGHDKFPLPLARQVLGVDRATMLESLDGVPDGVLNMTHLALALSRYVNGVAMRHGQISRDMFPGYPVCSITNGVHAPTWTRCDPSSVCLTTTSLSGEATTTTCATPSPSLLTRYGRRMWNRSAISSRKSSDEPASGWITAFALGFARRASTACKHADLLLSDTARLKRIARQVGPVQIILCRRVSST